MKAVLSAFDPRRIAGQIATLISLSVVIACLIVVGLVLSLGPGERLGPPLQDQLATLIHVVNRAPDGPGRDAILRAVGGAYPGFDIRTDVARPIRRASADDTRGLGHLQRALLPAAAAELADEDSADPSRLSRISIRLSDGSYLSAGLDLRDPGSPVVSLLIQAGVASILVTSLLLSLWATRALTSPLRRFAAAAEGFSVDGDQQPLPEDGPAEIRIASRALNGMRERIRHMVEDRTRMLAAVSHDLRTPITRLRLRAEFVTEETTREPMLRDLDQMNAMISGALAHLRDGQSGEVVTKVDLSALLATVADDFCDIGGEVTFEGPARVIVLGRSDELGRAVTNLVENALKYGQRGLIKLRPFSGVVEIDVVDDGPGIPPELRDALMQPFARGDASRNLNGPVGFGLGLSIVRAVAESHGGSLTLLDDPTGGLIARITLPRPPG